jgi:hypothetical protein
VIVVSAALHVNDHVAVLPSTVYVGVHVAALGHPGAASGIGAVFERHSIVGGTDVFSCLLPSEMRRVIFHCPSVKSAGGAGGGGGASGAAAAVAPEPAVSGGGATGEGSTAGVAGGWGGAWAGDVDEQAANAARRNSEDFMTATTLTQMRCRRRTS